MRLDNIPNTFSRRSIPNSLSDRRDERDCISPDNALKTGFLTGNSRNKQSSLLRDGVSTSTGSVRNDSAEVVFFLATKKFNGCLPFGSANAGSTSDAAGMRPSDSNSCRRRFSSALYSSNSSCVATFR